MMSDINDEAHKLLMMFIGDAYSQTGRPSRRTVVSMMAFVNKVNGLQSVVNNGTPHEISKFDIATAMERTK